MEEAKERKLLTIEM